MEHIQNALIVLGMFSIVAWIISMIASCTVRWWDDAADWRTCSISSFLIAVLCFFLVAII